MKLRALRFGCVALLAVGLLDGRGSAAAATAAQKTTAPTKAAPAEAAKKEEAMGKVEGVEVKRGDGYFGVAVADGHFKITFYDAKRHVVAAPVKRIALRWPVNYQPGDERTVVDISADGKSLTGGKIVRAPYAFKLFITFLADDATGTATETYVIDFRG